MEFLKYGLLVFCDVNKYVLGVMDLVELNQSMYFFSSDWSLVLR